MGILHHPFLLLGTVIVLTLYQFNSCPFCGKVRALLNYAKIPYTVVEVSPFGMKELDFTTHKKVPVLRDGEQVLVESAAIVVYLNEHYAHLPATDRDAEWSAWLDQTLVHYLPPLIHPEMGQSFKNLGLLMQGQPGSLVKRWFSRLAGAVVMPRVAKRMQQKHAIQQPEAEFHAALDHWVQAGLAGQAFFGGVQPGLLDTSVFGVLHSAAGMGILERASAHNPAFGRWYQATRALAA